MVRRRHVQAEIAARSTQRLDSRLDLVDFARGLRPRCGPTTQKLAADAPIWQFWATGVASAPALVRRCMQTVTEYAGSHPVRVLTQENYRDYVRLPARIEALKPRIGWTHYSDLLRVWLLAEHGGCWVDATVRLSAPVPTDLVELPFFAFTRPEDPFILSSWFMQATPEHPILLALQKLLDRYWAERDTMTDYFLLHFMFELAITSQTKLRTLWMATPVRGHEPAHRLQGDLGRPFDRAVYDTAVAESWLHKLTWKLPPDALDAGTLGAWLTTH